MSKRVLNILTAVVVLAVAAPALAGDGQSSIAAQRRAWQASALALSECDSTSSIDLLLAANSTANFCDGSHGAGTSATCKAWGQANPAGAPSISCPAGETIGNLNCSPSADQLCASGWYCTCSWSCKKRATVDPKLLT